MVAPRGTQLLFDRIQIKAVPAVHNAYYDFAADLLRLMTEDDRAAAASSMRSSSTMLASSARLFSSSSTIRISADDSAVGGTAGALDFS